MCRHARSMRAPLSEREDERARARVIERVERRREVPGSLEVSYIHEYRCSSVPMIIEVQCGPWFVWLYAHADANGFLVALGQAPPHEPRRLPRARGALAPGRERRQEVGVHDPRAGELRQPRAVARVVRRWRCCRRRRARLRWGGLALLPLVLVNCNCLVRPFSSFLSRSDCPPRDRTVASAGATSRPWVGNEIKFKKNDLDI